MYPEVQKRLLKAVSALREASQMFCRHITSSRHLIPYAIQYMAKVMKAALHNRFPHIPEKEILKVRCRSGLLRASTPHLKKNLCLWWNLSSKRSWPGSETLRPARRSPAPNPNSLLAGCGQSDLLPLHQLCDRRPGRFRHRHALPGDEADQRAAKEPRQHR